MLLGTKFILTLLLCSPGNLAERCTPQTALRVFEWETASPELCRDSARTLATYIATEHPEIAPVMAVGCGVLEPQTWGI